MLVTTNWIENHYNKFNQLYFRGTLPAIKFKTNKTKHSWGYASFIYDYKNDTIIPNEIVLSNYYDSPKVVKIQTLLHEMIHIADYTWHPEHFIKNGRRIGARKYDPHGSWFMTEAKRISKESGYSVANHVTSDEQKVSKLSNSIKVSNQRKINKALICTVIGDKGVWYFKTDIDKVAYLKSRLPKMYDWKLTIGNFKTVKFYTFINNDFATRRSCRTNIRGWRTDRIGMLHKLEDFKATEVFL